MGIAYGVLTKELFVGRALITFSVFTLLPVVYLALRKEKDWGKILCSIVIFGILFAVIFDFFEEYTAAWHTVSLVFPFKLFGIDPIDNIFAHIEMTLLTIVFYQHFIDDGQSPGISKRIFLAIALSLCGLIGLLLLYSYFPTLLQIKYSYAYMGTLASAFPILLVFRKPSLVKNMLSTSTYFFILYFCIEIVAVRNTFWMYSGSYLGWIHVLGVSFPFEELFFWMMLYAICIVSYYEVFIKR